ncbi:MAG: signal peptidase I [Verrucomicrobiota bacterium]
MNYFIRRKYLKHKKHVLHEARHARCMREDAEAPENIRGLLDLESQLEAAWEKRDDSRMDELFESILSNIKKIYPAKGPEKLRENLEILVVAVAVALGVRTYFVQPFKIPTGSMQPTLNGIRFIDDQDAPETRDAFPQWVFNYLVDGTRYVEVRARASGLITSVGRADNFQLFDVGGKKHRILSDMYDQQRKFERNEFVKKGQVLASGRLLSGDHILVNKVKFNFARPSRGDITVFSTKYIEHSDIKQDSFYIKRMVGLPGEHIQLGDDGFLYNRAGKIAEPAPFNWLLGDKYAGQKGRGFFAQDGRLFHNGVPYIRGHGPYTTGPRSDFELADNQYLFFGDNTLSSLDGRYFGGVQRESIIGPAFAVYWPFKERARFLRTR